MKKPQYLKIIGLLGLLLLTTESFSQKKGYKKGYILTLKKDTIKGWVKDRSEHTAFLEIYDRIRFRAEKPRFRKRYRANDILGYGYQNRHFKSVPLHEQSSFFNFRYLVDDAYPRVFLKRIMKSDQLTYYEREFIDDDNSYLDSYELLYKNNTNEMVRATQGLFGLKRKRLAAYFEDCAELVEKVVNKSLKTTAEVFDVYMDACSD